MRMPGLFAFSVVLLAATQAREIVPGIVSFEEPEGFHGFPPHRDPGDNPFNLSQTVRQYQPADTGPQSFRQFDIGIGVVGYSFGNGKRVTYRQLSEAELKQALLQPFTRSKLGAPPLLQETEVSGRLAYVISYQVPTPSFRKDAVFWREYYYVPYEPNRGVTLSLAADTEAGLASLRPLVKRVTIPKDARYIAPPPPPPPPPPTAQEIKREQIVKNLRLITAAGDQCQLRHGREKFTLEELRRDFATELAALKSIDGENYEQLVWELGKPLRVQTHTLGVVEYSP